MRKRRHETILLVVAMGVMTDSLAGCTVHPASAGNTIPEAADTAETSDGAGSDIKNDNSHSSDVRASDTNPADNTDDSDINQKQNQTDSNASDNAQEQTERVSISHDGITLSIALPASWSHRLCSAEECAENDGMMRFGIEFWRNDAPDEKLSCGYVDFAGMCGTGVTIEEITLDSGMKAWKYTEEYSRDHRMWMSVILEPEGRTPKDGSFMIEAFINLDEWNRYEEEIMRIVRSAQVIT